MVFLPYGLFVSPHTQLNHLKTMKIEPFNSQKHLIIGWETQPGVSPLNILRNAQATTFLFGNTFILDDGYPENHPLGQTPQEPQTIYGSMFDIWMEGHVATREDLARQLVERGDGWYLPGISEVASLLSVNLAAYRQFFPPKIILALRPNLGDMIVIESTGPGNPHYSVKEELCSQLSSRRDDYTILLARTERPQS